eukprot:SAG22_NODE_200_length_15420_cov_4.424581_5_plen_73_part_00
MDAVAGMMMAPVSSEPEEPRAPTAEADDEYAEYVTIISHLTFEEAQQLCAQEEVLVRRDTPVCTTNPFVLAA